MSLSRKAQKEEMVGLAYRLTKGAGGEHDRLYRRPICVGAVVSLLAIPLKLVFWYIDRSDCFFTALALLLTMFGMFGVEDELRPSMAILLGESFC